MTTSVWDQNVWHYKTWKHGVWLTIQSGAARLKKQIVRYATDQIIPRDDKDIIEIMAIIVSTDLLN